MKRTFDVVTSASLLLVLAPLFLVLAGAILLTIGRPVFFRQARPGLRGKPFVLVKFRSMRSGNDAFGRVLPDAIRITRFGAWLRASSLDELPELWNVLRGEMSLVGPRPLLTEYLLLFTKRQARRHEVRPGITGWAQVNGRNSISWEQKFEYDVWYVENRTFWLDIKILWMTVMGVLRREGISSRGHVTTERFTGSTHG